MRTINYKGYNIEVIEDETSFTVDFKTGLSKAIYFKSDWTLEEALEDQINIFNN